MRSLDFAALATAAIVIAGPAHAQAPQTEKNVSMAMAIAIIQGTIEQCTKDGYKVSVTVVDKAGNEVARGLAAYDAADAKRIIGHKSKEIAALLGYRGRDEMIHRDDLVVS